MNSKEWYSQPMVLQNIIECGGWNREISLQARPYNIKKKEFHKRCMHMTTMPYAMALLANDEYEVLDLFTSLPEYNLEPILNSKWNEKKDFFASTTPETWTLAFDFDSSEDPINALPSLLNSLEFCASAMPKNQYSIKFSGSKGWHLVSDHKTKYVNGLANNIMLADSLKLMDKAPCVDTVIYTPRREWRCPWSLHHSGLVAMPFSLPELRLFVAHYPESKHGLEPGEVMQRYPISGQGMKWISVNEQFWDDLNKLKKVVIT